MNPSVRRTRFITGLISFVLSILFAVVTSGASIDTTNLLGIVADRQSPSIAFENALRALDNVKTDEKFWLQRAADQMLDPNRRRKCAKYFFEHVEMRDLTLGKLFRSLDGPANWISAEKIDTVSPFRAGFVPKNVDSPKIQSLFFIPILSTMRGDYRLGIYMGLGKDLSKSELQQAFKTGTAASSIGDVPIIAFAKYDTDDVEAKYPGDAWRVITW